MNLISFKKYSDYLRSQGYVREKGENVYDSLGFKSVFFSKPDEKLKYYVNVFLKNDGETDYVMSIAHGYGSSCFGWTSINIDMRKKFWKEMI